LPASAASVSTLVVSWKLAAEMKLELCTDALVMPSSCVLAVAGLGLAPLAGAPPRAFDLRVGLLERLGRNDRSFFEVAVALVGDLQALRPVPIHLAEFEASMTMPGSRFGVARVSTRTLRSIWATMISMCLSLISTRWLR
jgi:hypothetical protein